MNFNRELLDRLQVEFSGKRVLIIGELMHDYYTIGTASRISPEAPVPVVNVSHVFTTLGGAGNVATNVVSLGGKARICTVAPPDISDENFLMSNATGIINDYNLLVKEDRRSLILKHRCVVYPYNQIVLRMDYETVDPIRKSTEDELLNKIESVLPETDVIVLSDYNKGLFTSGLIYGIKTLVGRYEKPVIVDPKPNHMSMFADFDIHVPNKNELYRFYYDNRMKLDIVDTSLESIGMAVRNNLRVDHLIVTAGRDGIYLFGRDSIDYIKAFRDKSVFNVTGAGDTVVAVLALCNNSEVVNLKQAVELATVAAGVVISTPYTAVAEFDSLRNSLLNNNSFNSSSFDFSCGEKNVYH